MPEQRMRYDREFREGAVRIVEETGKPIAQVGGEPRSAVAALVRGELRFPRDRGGISYKG